MVLVLVLTVGEFESPLFTTCQPAIYSLCIYQTEAKAWVCSPHCFYLSRSWGWLVYYLIVCIVEEQSFPWEKSCLTSCGLFVRHLFECSLWVVSCRKVCLGQTESHWRNTAYTEHVWVQLLPYAGRHYQNHCCVHIFTWTGHSISFLFPPVIKKLYSNCEFLSTKSLFFVTSK